MKENYLHSVCVRLDCSPKERDHLISWLDIAVTAYLEDNPEADKASLTASFGTPEECAVRLLDKCDPTVIFAERQKKRRRHRVLTTILAVLLIAALGIAVYLWSHNWVIITQY